MHRQNVGQNFMGSILLMKFLGELANSLDLAIADIYTKLVCHFVADRC